MCYLFDLFSDESEVFFPKYSQTAILHAANFQRVVNLWNSVTLSLSFVLSDIDECALQTDNCTHICTNTDGSFQCSCFPGYTFVDGLCDEGKFLQCTCLPGGQSETLYHRDNALLHIAYVMLRGDVKIPHSRMTKTCLETLVTYL